MASTEARSYTRTRSCTIHNAYLSGRSGAVVVAAALTAETLAAATLALAVAVAAWMAATVVSATFGSEGDRIATSVAAGRDGGKTRKTKGSRLRDDDAQVRNTLNTDICTQ